MKEIIGKKLDEKVKAYLRREFPGKVLNRYIKINVQHEIYGLDGMTIKVVHMGEKEIGYQLVTNTKQ